MSQTKSFLRDLDEAVLRGTPESRTRALWHTTDLLIAGRYSDEEIWTFGEVIGRLAGEQPVAPPDNAPSNYTHNLPFDDSFDVAGPILLESERLEAYALVAHVCPKSQSHMLAISKRKSIDEAATEGLGQR